MRRSNLFCTGFFTIMILALTTSTSAFVSSDGDAVPEGLTRTAWQQMRAVIERDRYRLNRDEGSDAYRAPNPAQGLNAVFTQDGFAVSPGNGSSKGPSKESAWNWGLHLTAYGYGSDLRPVAGAAKLVSNGNRIEYQRGDLTEWYINDHRGLEQGFTLNARPKSWTASTPLELHMKAIGNLLPEVEKDGKGIIWRNARDEEVLRYSGLYAFDATGKALVARMSADSQGVRIVVADHEAVYPITIDPWVQKAKLTASDGAAFDNFGSSVAISGDTVVVGAVKDNIGANDGQGSAYVFEKPAGGWATTSAYAAKLTVFSGESGDYFGKSVAISGDTVVVGAYGDNNYGNSNQGSAYIFEKPVGGWTTTHNHAARLSDFSGAAEDRFGWSVTISDNTVVVGAIGANDEQGLAYIFEKPVSGWTDMNQSARLTASDGGNADHLGWSVAISGDTAVIGAPDNDVLSQTGFLITDQGSGYVFVKPVGGWADMNQTARLTASDGADDDYFGYSVAISDNTVVVGAHGDGSNQGSVYVFNKPGGGWATTSAYTAKLTASNGTAEDRFGWSVAISGDTVLVGVPYDHIGTTGNQGSACLFEKPDGSWANMNQSTMFTAADGANSDNFGQSVAISGDTVVVGSPDDAVGTNGDQGSAYIFEPGEGIFFPIKARNGKTTVIYLE